MGQPGRHGLHQLAVHHEMQVLIELLADGGQHARVPVPHVTHANTGDEVKHSAALGGVHEYALGPLDFEQQREVGRLGLVAEEELACSHRRFKRI